ncbi:hypothetical protein HJD18_01815 [Thermoleophilia bacterium SCSIO 60948]|nr:hypothetical protein HJD18_01815 [Thermoleophilia bacterium SCSIO 60948]
MPRPAFRGDLGRRLSAMEARGSGVSLRAIKLRIAALASSGGALLALAFAGVLGAGPLA